MGLGEEVEFDLGEHGEVIAGKVSSEQRQERFGRCRGFSGPGVSADEVMEMTRGEDR